jgi:TatD DNase family protein
MTLRFFDAHTHVNFAAFEKDYKEVIDQALAVGVGAVNVGTQKDTSRRAIEIAHEFENEPVYATIGLHPIHTSKSYHDPHELGGSEEAKSFTSRGEEFDYDYYKNLALDSKVIAIGECGLDYYRAASGKRQETNKKQRDAFIKQIELAHEVKKPLMIHCRSAFPELIQLLVTNYQLLVTPHPGIIHFFSGTKEDTQKLLELGFFFTFGGLITFARDYDEVIKSIPLGRILSETDAPYVAPEPYREKRNEPAYVIEVVKKLAEIKDIPLEKTRSQIFENTKRVFNIDFVNQQSLSSGIF